MNCKACQIEIEEADDAGPLSNLASAHLESCANCSTFCDEHRALRAMIGGLEVVTAPADFDFRLRARLAALKSESRGVSFFSRYAPSPRSVAFAAGLLVVFMIGLLVRQAVLEPGEVERREQAVTTNPVETVVPIAQPATAVPAEKPQDARELSSTSLPDSTVVRSEGGSRRRINPGPKGANGGSTRDDVIDSMDMGSTSTANSVLPPGIPDPMTLSTSAVAVPVRAPMQPRTILLKNGDNKPQSISLRPVTFGGQDLFEQGSAKKAIVTSGQGIW